MLLHQHFSSVADPLEFLMKSGDSKFVNASATIEFIRVIDKLFDLLNSKNLLSNGFKKPLNKVDMNIWVGTIDSSIDYLRKLCDIYGTPLFKHRRKTFVIGFITALSSVKKLALYLLCKNENPYYLVLTYKFSQENPELLFACIRSKNGWNNNPDQRQLKSALRRILLRISNKSSTHYNCLVFEKDVSPIFSLKWTKKRSPLLESLEYDEENEDSDFISNYLSNDINSDFLQLLFCM